MKLLLLFFSAFFSLQGFSQKIAGKTISWFNAKETYISLNPFSVAEPQFALGPSFGQRFSERSEYFVEVAYVGKGLFNEFQDLEKLSGARFIFQYRYHFLQNWRPLINFGLANRERKRRHQPFIGLEWRMKPVSFKTTGNFYNTVTMDTLSGYRFSAGAFTYGGALVFGETFNLSADEKWKLEITAGIGAKQRNVNLKTVPAGYRAIPAQAKEWFVQPYFYESAGGALIPMTIRIRYALD